MKIKQQLALFLILLCFYANSVKVQLKSNQHLRGYFYVQKLYPGNDPLENIKESEYHMSKKYFEVNDEMIFFVKSVSKMDDVEDSISFPDLYDDKMDSAGESRCCSRIIYEEFPAAKGLKSILPAAVPATAKPNQVIAKANAVTKALTSFCRFKQVLSPMDIPSLPYKEINNLKNKLLQANYCLNLMVPDEARWRICSDKKNNIAKIQLKMTFAILKLKTANKAGFMDRFLNNIKVASPQPKIDWTWHTQDKWPGKCASTFMQSPINVNRNKVTKADSNFSLSFHLTQVNTIIKKNQPEIMVGFLNFGGLIKLNIENTFILYTPQYMSFRFPGENLFDGERYDGEIQLHLAEVSSQRVNN